MFTSKITLVCGRLFGIWAVVNAVACASAPISLSASPEYSMGFYNSTAETIKDIVVDWGPAAGRHMEDKGAMSSHSIATIGQERRPIPKVFAVTWRTGDGKVHNQRIERKTIEPEEDQFAGTLWFTFRNTTVEVAAMTYAEQDRRAATGKAYYPE